MMNDTVKKEDENNKPAEDEKKPYRTPFWKKLMLGVALLTGLAGSGLYALVHFASPQPQMVSASDGHEPQVAPGTFLAQGTEPQPSEPRVFKLMGDQVTISEVAASDWGTLLMKLGFSFVVGFAIGYAVSGMIRVALFFAGIVLLILFGLQYTGIIEVSWGEMEKQYNSLVERIIPMITEFKNYIAEHLSASSMATLGLITGLRRK
jgi:uncharacterized membrane protein (Fun14 family)